jgi:RimK-like ATP-grasp domain
VILLAGIPSETPLAMVREELNALGSRYVVFNQRRFASMAIDFGIDGGALSGTLDVGGERYSLDAFEAVYTRLMDDQRLPELRTEPPASPARTRARSLHDALIRWSEISPARVVNRIAPMGSNFSKPYQAQLIREAGLAVPETLITNDPALVLAFRERHGRLVYKSISGVRSIVKTLEDEDLQRLERIRWCPTQFQQFVDGIHVRVHTVGEQVFATALESEVTDYRYARQEGAESPELRAVELDDELAERCVALARRLELPFAGIDLKISPDEEAYCFEVNPCPAFSYFEYGSGQPIARSLARYLAGNAG